MIRCTLRSVKTIVDVAGNVSIYGNARSFKSCQLIAQPAGLHYNRCVSPSVNS